MLDFAKYSTISSFHAFPTMLAPNKLQQLKIPELTAAAYGEQL